MYVYMSRHTEQTHAAGREITAAGGGNGIQTPGAEGGKMHDRFGPSRENERR